MGLFELHDDEAESRDDIVRMEIEEEAKEKTDPNLGLISWQDIYDDFWSKW